MANTLISRVARTGQAVIVLALAFFMVATVVTFIAIEKSRSRTVCLRSAQSIDQCPVPSEWENLLRRATTQHSLGNGTWKTRRLALV